VANQLIGNPLIIDTASSTITEDHVTVVGVRWVGATTNAHEAILTDTAGLVKWRSKHATAGLGIAESSGIRWTSGGLKVTTLGSGILYIYLA
jgi:hypothetical protein